MTEEIVNTPWLFTELNREMQAPCNTLYIRCLAGEVIQVSVGQVAIQKYNWRYIFYWVYMMQIQKQLGFCSEGERESQAPSSFRQLYCTTDPMRLSLAYLL